MQNNHYNGGDDDDEGSITLFPSNDGDFANFDDDGSFELGEFIAPYNDEDKNSQANDNNNKTSKTCKTNDNITNIEFGDLEITKLIGSGGFCDVHAATFRYDRKKELAVKLVRGSGGADPDPSVQVANEDILNEARILANLPKHNNIVYVHGVASVTDNACLVMNRVETTLAECLKNWRQEQRKALRSSWIGKKDNAWKDRVSSVATGILSGLQFLHERGVVHRDIKPSNIGIDACDNAVLFDFGLAREIVPLQASWHGSLDSIGIDFDRNEDDNDNNEVGFFSEYGHSSDSHLSDDSNFSQMLGPTTSGRNHPMDASAIMNGVTVQSSGPCGTVKYMSPEIASSGNYGVSADIYSFGIVLWEIVCLRVPFSRCRTKEAVLEATKDGVRPPLRVVPNNKDLRKLINGCWNDDPNKRPTAEWARHRLSTIITAKAASPTTTTRRDGRSNRIITHQPKRSSQSPIRQRISVFHKNLMNEVQAVKHHQLFESC